MNTGKGPDKSFTGTDLFNVMVLSKTDPKTAAEKILYFTQVKFPDLKIKRVEINQSKVSLNSVNGNLYSSDGNIYFFKFHAEEGEQATMDEYYQAEELSKVGMPIIKPVYESTQPGSQFLVYDRVEAPTAFEAFGNCENQFIKEGTYKGSLKDSLMEAETDLLRKVSEIYLKTLEQTDSIVVSQSALNQLFFRRLVGVRGEKPRIDLYYTGKKVQLPDGSDIAFDDLAEKNWVINGVEYRQSISQIIREAKTVLDPLANPKTPTVLGHGDDHNGNKFFVNNSFILFDPAFAGRQPALLSFVKATAHNTFLHPFWLYEPERLNKSGLEMECEITQEEIIVNHNWSMDIRSPLRSEILKIQIEAVWKPLLREMKNRGVLQDNWREYLRKALFCCPFLVYNLINPEKYSPQASILALSKCVELGSDGQSTDYVDLFLDALGSAV